MQRVCPSTPGQRQVPDRPADTAAMPKRPAKPPEPPRPAPLPRWAIYRAAHRLIWMAEVDAADESEAAAKGAGQLKLPGRSVE